MSELLKRVTAAKVVRVRPGDVIWLKTDLPLTAQQAASIREQARTFWPDNEVVVGVAMDVEVIRATKVPA